MPPVHKQTRQARYAVSPSIYMTGGPFGTRVHVPLGSLLIGCLLHATGTVLLPSIPTCFLFVRAMRRMVFFIGMLVRTKPPAAWMVATHCAFVLPPWPLALRLVLPRATPAKLMSSNSAAADLSPLIRARRNQVWLPAAAMPLRRVRAARLPSSAACRTHKPKAGHHDTTC